MNPDGSFYVLNTGGEGPPSIELIDPAHDYRVAWGGTTATAGNEFQQVGARDGQFLYFVHGYAHQKDGRWFNGQMLSRMDIKTHQSVRFTNGDRRQCSMEWQTLIATLLAMARQATLVLAQDVTIVATFEGDKGPGWKPTADISGAVGPKHVVDLDAGAYVVHDKVTGKVLKKMTPREFQNHVEPFLHPPESHLPLLGRLTRRIHILEANGERYHLHELRRPSQRSAARPNETEAWGNSTPVAGRGIYRPGAELFARHLPCFYTAVHTLMEANTSPWRMPMPRAPLPPALI